MGSVQRRWVLSLIGMVRSDEFHATLRAFRSSMKAGGGGKAWDLPKTFPRTFNIERPNNEYKYFREVLSLIIIRPSEISSKTFLKTTSSKLNLHPVHLFKISFQEVFHPLSKCFLPFLLALFSSF